MISIILPTYNERENVQRMIPELEGLIRKQKWNAEILIVDDTSPDGTADAVRKFQKRYRNVRLILRKKKEGPGAAMKEGYDKAKGEVMVSLDADFLYTEEIPRLLAKLAEGYDFVVGARNIPGGGYEEKDWKTTLKIKLFSLPGNLLTRFLFPIGVTDFTHNFRALRRKMWKRIQIEEKGNAFFLETIIRVHAADGRIGQIPVFFRDRVAGESKLNFTREVPRYFLKLIEWRLRL